MDFIDLNELRSVEELSSYKKELESTITSIDTQHAGLPLPEDVREDYARAVELRGEIGSRVKELEARKAYIKSMAEAESRTERPVSSEDIDKRSPKVPLAERDIYDLSTVRAGSNEPAKLRVELIDRAQRALEIANLDHLGARGDSAKLKGHVAKLLSAHEDEAGSYRAEAIARRMLLTGSPTYRKAFMKTLAGGALSPQEQAAMADVQNALRFEERTALGVGSTGFPVVWTLDPTLVPTSNFAVNPWRALARNVTIAGTNEWRAVTSGGITAAYAAEGTEASDNTPTLAQPDIFAERAQAYAIYSIEASQDWAEIQSALGGDLQDAKDVLEATQFATGAGHGSNAPKGVITGATNTTQTTTTGAFVVADIYKVFEALPARFRPRAQFAANLFVIDKIRQFDTTGAWVGFNQILNAAQDAGGAGTVPGTLATPLLGRAVHEATAMAATLTTTTKILLTGDFNYFVIVDRVGMNVEVDPMVLGSNRRPTGQRALYAYWRNSSDVLSAAAFQVLVT